MLVKDEITGDVYNIEKAEVSAHTKKTKTGKVVQVKQYATKKTKKKEFKDLRSKKEVDKKIKDKVISSFIKQVGFTQKEIDSVSIDLKNKIANISTYDGRYTARLTSTNKVKKNNWTKDDPGA